MKRPHTQRYPATSWSNVETEFDEPPAQAYREAKRREHPRSQRVPQASAADWGDRLPHKAKKNTNWRYANETSTS